MQSGLMLGHVGLVEAMVHRYRAEMEAPNATVVATGGLASLIATATDVIDVVDLDLTLTGLQYVFTLNREPQSVTTNAGGTP